MSVGNHLVGGGHTNGGGNMSGGSMYGSGLSLTDEDGGVMLSMMDEPSSHAFHRQGLGLVLGLGMHGMSNGMSLASPPRV